MISKYPFQFMLSNLRKINSISFCRPIHNETDKRDFHIEELKHRKVIRVAGEDSSEFLQGLITNDMNNLTSSMYAMFLNNKGRVLFDSIIYHVNEKNSFLLECDSQVVNQFVKHLNIYKLRKKVVISSLDSALKVWCIYNTNEGSITNEEKVPINITNLSENKNLVIVPDPRTSLLGYRMISKGDEDLLAFPKSDNYQVIRYKLGVGEGVDELLMGQSFPLEMNCDYLNGVSFDKGCYIGQELTARTYHTGVIRKRLMPLTFDSEPLGIPVNSPIEDLTHQRKSPIGKLRAVKGINGLGLMRVTETMESNSLKLLSCTAQSYVPDWWPVENVQKTYVKIKK